MTETYTIPVTKAEKTRLGDVDFTKLPFGKVFTDHMLVADYIDGKWQNVSIQPYGNISISPALASLHYGQAIFEGIKAYKGVDGNGYIFRPFDNFKRFNQSAVRMDMPEVPEDIFIEGMRQLIALDIEWIPAKADHALYIRPFMFSTDEVIGVKTSEHYKFMILLCPTGPYFSEPAKIKVEDTYTRAAQGGVGYVKCAGNYGASMFVTAEAKRQGYHQVLWMDAVEHKYVQEIGTMNVFFVIDNKVYTPSLEGSTILAGVTRNSAIQVIRDMGYEVIEEPIHIDNVVKAYKEGRLTEVFGTGTAATISPIRLLNYNGLDMEFDVSSWVIAPGMKKILDEIKERKREDVHNWLFKV
ncbi:branched-chain amino acid aminotransferase [Gynurincola endophyticus]|jgi:branched-chain amino acid aminotransferase|uniref:branched-chain amino acid aminotransferase n=1 Tax=Gynurincola endophyticus TaxID=2479004 RepID=UPI000F8DDCC2|nr:branched-chain amino acid aminotransferase [Gynurincola endophyticus]